MNELSRLIPPRPRDGWIAEIRSLLLMTSSQLARRVGVSQSVISNLQKSEREKTITLKSLEKVANALECELVYVLIPKK
jgi:DNA-binding Xre family transcriptional regulator